ncbi:MAG TPA: 2-C-methyl-D-erythritol 2,4-cyclodiphosphate synthase [Gemmatimonadales bacterium]|nr:2-C-methyl-D-erythritol 2,4-cyclodiphosphate synthase [Gemmatimonadales bacterium]
MSRTGIGYDSHRFEAGRPLVLGGVAIPSDRGLTGHSDADAIAHALTDAILGAAAAGDIGRLFPDTDPQWKGADSMKLLAAAHATVQAKGWRFVQGDVTVICERPKLAPHLPAIAERLATALGVTPDAVGVKAKTNEGMGWIGRAEGIAVMAVATVEPVR